MATKAQAKAIETEASPVLELSTTDWPRHLFTIDGKRYWMRCRQELTTEQLKELGALQEEINTADDLDGLDGALTESAHRVTVDVPPAAMAKLTIEQKARILGTFSQLAGWTAAPASKTKAKAKKRSSGKSRGTRSTRSASGKSSRSRGRSGSSAGRSRSG